MSETVTLRPDSKGRISLGSLAKGISSFHVKKQKDNSLILEPYVEIPAREAWVHTTPGILENIQIGLEEASRNQVTRMDFSNYLEALFKPEDFDALDVVYDERRQGYHIEGSGIPYSFAHFSEDEKKKTYIECDINREGFGNGYTMHLAIPIKNKRITEEELKKEIILAIKKDGLLLVENDDLE